MEEVKNYYAGRHLISMEEDIVSVCRKSKISMQEGREVEGKSAIRISSNIVDYCLSQWFFYKKEKQSEIALDAARLRCSNIG